MFTKRIDSDNPRLLNIVEELKDGFCTIRLSGEFIYSNLAAVEMLGFVGLDAEEIMNKLPEQLSGGMQRRVAIGRSLLSTAPKAMLYDEPTTGLDPQSTENVLELIAKLNKEREIATIVVTHQITDAIGFAKRFVVIIDGEIAFDGNLEELRDSRDLNVLQFLAPFRLSFNEVLKKEFFTYK